MVWWFFIIFLLSLFQTCFLFSSPIPSPQLCLYDERSALLQLKQKHYDVPPDYNYPMSWKPNTDCCFWEGITCDTTTGHVVGLDLSDSSLYGSIHSNSSLFHLHHLQTLNLSWNLLDYFAPSGFKNLSRLMHLNLSGNLFWGRIPTQISQLKDLVSLDLSTNQFEAEIPSEISQLTKLVSFDFSGNLLLEIPNLGEFGQNLSSLRELNLDEVDLPTSKNRNWCRHLSSTLPKLHVLSMKICSLTGPLDASISNFHFLSELYLDFNNNLSSTIPSSLIEVTSLTVLSLYDCGLLGHFPSNIFLLPNLKYIDLSKNPLLSAHLPEFPRVHSALQYLNVGGTNFQGKLLSSSIGNLKFLKELNLSSCNLTGPIPLSLANLTHLTVLDLSSNNFSGQIPSFFWERFPNLVRLYLHNNLLQGTIHSYLFFLPSLCTLDLSYNQFSGVLHEHIHHNNSSFCSPDSIYLKGQDPTELLSSLDISSNRIVGAIPKWIWQKNWIRMNLSNNLFTGMEFPILGHPFSIAALDLHSNIIQDCLSIGPSFPHTFNQSNCEFQSPILGNLTSLISKSRFFSISNNIITGKIPFSICNATDMDILDLSNNQLSGTIPTCLCSSNLGVLNLEGNKLYGHIPPFKKGCNLQTLKLNKNMLQGKVPKSLCNCDLLNVLDIADNQLNDTFPYWLENLSNLEVLVMRSNKFGGPIAHVPQSNSSPFQSLHVIDLSSNNFTENLPLQYICHWMAMMKASDWYYSELTYQSSENFSTYYYSDTYTYQDIVAIVDKRLYLEIRKINIFTTVDLSNNNFEGRIPDALGNLKLLRLLNLSGNSFTGQIPFSLGNLSELESLDLSRNKLSGEIPKQLITLTFLAVLDLSYNNLVGSIPLGNQFNTFSNTSYEGNGGLCGFPLSKKCEITGEALPPSMLQEEDDSTCLLDWKFVLAGYCSGLVVGLVIGQQLFWRRNRCSNFISRVVASKRTKVSRKIKHHSRGK